MQDKLKLLVSLTIKIRGRGITRKKVCIAHVSLTEFLGVIITSVILLVRIESCLQFGNTCWFNCQCKCCVYFCSNLSDATHHEKDKKQKLS